MRVVSNYSGWEHNDQGDFEKRVDDALLKLQTPTPSEPTKRRTPRNRLFAGDSQDAGTTGN
jgi:hypothetical protein